MPLPHDELNELPPDLDLWVLRGPNGEELTVTHAAYPGTAVVYAFLSENDAKTVLDRIPADAPAFKFGKPHITTVPKSAFTENIAHRRKHGEAVGFAILTPNEVFDFWWPKE